MYDAFIGGLIPKDQLGPSPLKSTPMLKLNTSSLVKSFESRPNSANESTTEIRLQRQSSPFPSPKLHRRVLSLSHARSGLGMSFLEKPSSDMNRMSSTPHLFTKDNINQTSSDDPSSLGNSMLNDPVAIPTLHIESPTTPEPPYSYSLSYSTNSPELARTQHLSPASVYQNTASNLHSPVSPTRRPVVRNILTNDLNESVRHWSLNGSPTLSSPASATSAHHDFFTSPYAHRSLRRNPNYPGDTMRMSEDTMPAMSIINAMHDHTEVHHRGSFSTGFRRTGTSADHFGSLVGSYEESILSGRMSTLPSKPIHFIAEIGVIASGKCRPSLKCPHHIQLEFPAFFYELEEDESPTTPYVGTIDLRNRTAMLKPGHSVTNGNKMKKSISESAELSRHVATELSGAMAVDATSDSVGHEDHVTDSPKNKEYGYRLPPKGQLQIIIKNPSKTAIKVFLVPYDFNDMPPNTKTFIRQKSYEQRSPNSAGTPTTTEFPILLPNHSSVKDVNASSNSLSERLRFAVHLQFQRTSKGRIYLCKTIRVVFNHRAPDKEIKLRTVNEGPLNPKYIPLSTPMLTNKEEEETTVQEDSMQIDSETTRPPAYPFH